MVAKKRLRYFLHTRGRIDNQKTLAQLPPEIINRTYMVCDSYEYKAHQKAFGKLFTLQGARSVSKQNNGILSFKNDKNTRDIYLAHKRRWIVDYCIRYGIDYMILLDDDLTFWRRNEEGKLRKVTGKKLLEGFVVLRQWLDAGYGMVGFSAIELNRSSPGKDFLDNTRIMRVLGFNVEVLKEKKINFELLPTMEDFDINLQILKAGHDNRCLYTFASSHKGSNEPGGCALYRGPVEHEWSARRLQELHGANIVKVMKKKTAKPWPGYSSKYRIDVTVSWKKAREVGRAASKTKTIRDFF